MPEQLLPNLQNNVLSQLLQHPQLNGIAAGAQHQNAHIQSGIPHNHRKCAARCDGVHGVSHQHRAYQIAAGHNHRQQQCQRHSLFPGAQICHQPTNNAWFILLHGAPPFPPGAEAPTAAVHRAVHSCRPAAKAPHGYRTLHRRRFPGTKSGPHFVQWKSGGQ